MKNKIYSFIKLLIIENNHLKKYTIFTRVIIN